MGKEYIKVKIEKPTTQFSKNTDVLKTMNDDFWKDWIFYYLLLFYKDSDKVELKQRIEKESKKSKPRIEQEITKFIRKNLNRDKNFSENFYAFGENINDEEVEGYYDITIHSTHWRSKNFHFECKNLKEKSNLIKAYTNNGVYRYFNGKYATNQNFGGMIGFVLNGNYLNIKAKLHNQLNEKFDITPEGDLIKIDNNKSNNFTFDSYHSKKNEEFVIHHLLFDFL